MTQRSNHAAEFALAVYRIIIGAVTLPTGEVDEQIQRYEEGSQEKAQAQSEGKKTAETGQDFRLISVLLHPFQ